MLNTGIQGFVDPRIIESYERIVTNELAERRQVLNELTLRHYSRDGGSDRNPDKRRDIYKECGIPYTENVKPELLYELYRRNGPAGRVVELWPSEGWQKPPDIYEDENEGVSTAFEQALASISKGLELETSYYEEQEGNPLYEYLYRAHVLSGIGRYGVIFLGTDDVNSQTISQELPDAEYGARQLRYLSVLPETQAEITSLDSDPASPRYGLPQTYNLQFADPKDALATVQGTTGVTSQTQNVHWSRIIHISHGISSNKVLGVSLLMPVLDYILSLDKVYPGSAELYWKNSSPGIAVETHPQLGGDVMVNRTKFRNQMEQYMHGLQRYLLLMGMSAKTLAPNVTDPTPYVKNLLECIAIRLGVPMRIFMGSERGELSSSQDTDNWVDRVMGYNKNFTTPRVIVPFINRLINKGILPRPSRFYVEWPDLRTKDEAQQVDNNSKRVANFTTYLEGPMSQVIAPIDFLTRFDTFTTEEAEEMLENGQANLTSIAEVVEQPTEETIDVGVEEQTMEEVGTDVQQMGETSTDGTGTSTQVTETTA